MKMSTMTMAMHASSSVSPPTSFSLLNRQNQSSISCIHLPPLSRSSPPPLSNTFNPLRSFIGHYGIRSIAKSKTSNRNAGFSVFCYTPAPRTPLNIQWISTISYVVLILAKGTVPKWYIVPLFALQAPAGVVSWIKSRYGVWTAFLAFLIRLFFYIPGVLELPLLTLLLVMIAPSEAMKLRHTKVGDVISLLIAVYLAFQHFSRTTLPRSFAIIAVICITVVVAVISLLIVVNLAFQHFLRSLHQSYDQDSIVATIAVICITRCCDFIIDCGSIVATIAVICIIVLSFSF